MIQSYSSTRTVKRKNMYLLDDAKKDDGEEDSEFTGNGGRTSVGALEIGDLVTFSLDRNGKIDSLEYLAYTGSDVSDKEVNKNRTLFGNSKLDNGVIVFSYDDAYSLKIQALQYSILLM